MGMQRRWRAWLNNAVMTAGSRTAATTSSISSAAITRTRNTASPMICASRPTAPVDFFAGVTSAFLSATTFIVVLWTIGGALTLISAEATITIPGFLVIAAVIYAVIASGSMT